MVPVFLLAIPRTGTTVTQQVLGSYPEVATAEEPWLMLPLVGMLDPDRPGGGRFHATTAWFVRDFAGRLPGGEGELEAELRGLAERLYERAAKDGARFFLDKSPPYSLIVDDLMRVFSDDARFIFLWRNPLAVIASTLTAARTPWGGLHDHQLYNFTGLANLVRAYEANRDRAVGVRYEDLVGGDERAWRAITDHIGIDFDADSLTRFPEVHIRRRLLPDDPYDALSEGPLSKWREVIANPLRKEWARRYLRWIGRDRLAVMGYDLDALLAELDSVAERSDGLLSDSLSMAGVAARDLVNARLRQSTRGPSSLRMLLGA